METVKSVQWASFLPQLELQNVACVDVVEKRFRIILIVACVFLERLLRKEDTVNHVTETKSLLCLALVNVIVASLEQNPTHNTTLVWLVNQGSSPTEDSANDVLQEKSPPSPAQ